jgi:hypothetical protein
MEAAEAGKSPKPQKSICVLAQGWLTSGSRRLRYGRLVSSIFPGDIRFAMGETYSSAARARNNEPRSRAILAAVRVSRATVA